MAKLKRKEYDELLQPLQLELAAMARWVQHSGQRLLVLFEGRDTAGKGGAIQTISEHLNPRQCRVVALPKPTDREATQWYFQRYATHLPAAGEIVLMDRSWYNRAGVESVMGYATPSQVDTFLAQAPAFEQQLVDDGRVTLISNWQTITLRRTEAGIVAADQTQQLPPVGISGLLGDFTAQGVYEAVLLGANQHV